MAIPRKFRKVLVGVGVLSLALIFFGWWSAPPDPEFEGKRLSEHLRVLDGTSWKASTAEEYNQRREAAARALRSLKGEAVPLLQDWLRRPAAKWKMRLADLLEKARLPAFDLRLNRQSIALEAAQEMKDSAWPLLDELSGLVNHPDEGTALDATMVVCLMMEGKHGSEWLKRNPPDVDELLEKLIRGTRNERFRATALFRGYAREGQIPHSEELVQKLLEAKKAPVKLRPEEEANPWVWDGEVRYFGQNTFQACLEVLEEQEKINGDREEKR